MFAWVLWCQAAFTVILLFISTRTFWRVLTTSVDSCVEIKSAPSEDNQIWQNLEGGAGKRCLELECVLHPVFVTRL